MSSHQKVMLHGKETNFLTNSIMWGTLECPELIIGYYRFVIALELKAFPSEKRVPYRAGDNNRKEFLPFNTNPLFLIQAHVGRPVTLKPLSLQIAAEPYGASGVSIQF